MRQLPITVAATLGQTQPQLVKLGESTLEEMCLAGFVFVITP